MKASLLIVGAVVALALIAVVVFFVRYPAVGPAPDVHVESTPERLERGRYLALHVALCIDCHSQRDFSRFAGPVVPGTEGSGGEVFDHAVDVPGRIVAPNITPAALASWTDGEVIRAITEGVSKDGTALFPLMPYYSYRFLTREDLYSVVAYLRALPPIQKTHAPRHLDFPVNLVVRTLPQAASPPPAPNPDDLADYGRYLATVAACADCHTPFLNGAPDEARRYTGGRVFPYDGGVVVTPNLTPDPETGLGHWTEEQFVTRFKMYDNEEGRNLDPVEIGFNTMMPWAMYAGMEERDLRAIYAFLRTLPPVKAAHPPPGTPASH